jgi:hypothetical protein
MICAKDELNVIARAVSMADYGLSPAADHAGIDILLTGTSGAYVRPRGDVRRVPRFPASAT